MFLITTALVTCGLLFSFCCRALGYSNYRSWFHCAMCASERYVFIILTDVTSKRTYFCRLLCYVRIGKVGFSCLTVTDGKTVVCTVYIHILELISLYQVSFEMVSFSYISCFTDNLYLDLKDLQQQQERLVQPFTKPKRTHL